MDFLPVIVLIVLGTMIFDRKNRRTGRTPTEEEYEVPERDEMSWEEMERHYGLKMERRETPEERAARERAKPGDDVFREVPKTPADVLPVYDVPTVETVLADVRASAATGDAYAERTREVTIVEKRAVHPQQAKRPARIRLKHAKAGVVWAEVLGAPKAIEKGYFKR